MAFSEYVSLKTLTKCVQEVPSNSAPNNTQFVQPKYLGLVRKNMMPLGIAIREYVHPFPLDTQNTRK